MWTGYHIPSGVTRVDADRHFRVDADVGPPAWRGSGDRTAAAQAEAGEQQERERGGARGLGLAAASSTARGARPGAQHQG